MGSHRRTDPARRGLLARVIERRRLDRAPSPDESDAATADEKNLPSPEAESARAPEPAPGSEPGPPAAGGQDERIAAIESRLDHLEFLIEGLQDAVHRDSTRHEREIRDLEQRTDPSEMSRSLAEHERQRGL